MQATPPDQLTPQATPSRSGSHDLSPHAPASAEAADLGGATRRGLLYITGAKLWFMVAGLLLQVLLPRAFGSSALFGVWTLVLAWVSTLNNVVVTATIQSVAHFAAAGPAATERAKATALRAQVLVGGGLTLLFVLAAPLISRFQRDAELTPLLRTAAIVLFSYSFYAVFVGAANGARQFHKQAGLDCGFSTLRAGLVISAAYVFHRPSAAVAAFACAAVLITLLSVVVVGLPRPALLQKAPPLATATLLRFSAWLALYLIAINLLMFLDGFWLKSLATEAYRQVPGLAPALAKESADALVGIYGAVQTVARLPYQLILAGAFVVFPLMSAAAAEPERARSYVAATLRYSLIGSVALVVGLGVRPMATMRLLYPAEYVVGAPALAVLLLGYLAFSLLTIVGTILNGVGRTTTTTAIGLTTVVLTMSGVYLALKIGLAAPGALPLARAATGMASSALPLCAAGMAAGVFAGLVLSLIALWRHFRATFAPLSLLRVLLAATTALALGRVWPVAGSAGLLGSKIGTLLCAGLAVVVYLGVLALARELSVAEVLSLRRQRPTA